MNRVRRNPFNVLFHEVNSVQEEFARLFHRLAPNTATAMTGPLLNMWEDDQALFAELATTPRTAEIFVRLPTASQK